MFRIFGAIPPERLLNINAAPEPTLQAHEVFANRLEEGEYHSRIALTVDSPSHIHIRKAGQEAKFWLNPIRLAHLGRFKPSDLRRMTEILEENQEYILERWNEQFNS